MALRLINAIRLRAPDLIDFYDEVRSLLPITFMVAKGGLLVYVFLYFLLPLWLHFSGPTTPILKELVSDAQFWVLLCMWGTFGAFIIEVLLVYRRARRVYR